MNYMLIHGRIQYLEPPKHERGSALAVVQIGREKPVSGALVQTVNRIMVRFPYHLQENVPKFNVGDYIEIFGHVEGIVRRPAANPEREFLSAEAVAREIRRCHYISPVSVPEDRLDRYYVGHYSAVGILMHVEPAEEPTRPTVAYVKIGPDKQDRGRLIERTSIVSMHAYDKAARTLKRIAIGEGILIDGRLTGVLRRHPRREGMQDSLELGLLAHMVQPAAFVPERILPPDMQMKIRAERRGEEIDEEMDSQTAREMTDEQNIK